MTEKVGLFDGKGGVIRRKRWGYLTEAHKKSPILRRLKPLEIVNTVKTLKSFNRKSPP